MSDGGVVGRTRRRVDGWILLDANRLVIAGSVLLAVFALLWLPEIRGSLPTWPSSTAVSLFAAFVTGNLTLVTVVLSINQLVLSRELRTPGEVRSQMDAAMEYRDEVADAMAASDADIYETIRDDDRAPHRQRWREGATPENLSWLLHQVVADLRGAVRRLAEASDELADEGRHRGVAALATTLESRIDEMDVLLGEQDVELFRALSTVLRYDLAGEYNKARWLARSDAVALDEPVVEALETIQRDLRYLEVARQYAKTLYVQAELASLSRLLLYVGLVSIVSSVLAVALDGSPVGRDPRLAMQVAITLGMAPLAVLLSYVLRIATVAELTTAFVPFGTPGQSGVN